jgi:hypothetical protein
LHPELQRKRAVTVPTSRPPPTIPSINGRCELKVTRGFPAQSAAFLVQIFADIRSPHLLSGCNGARKHLPAAVKQLR